jgi:hypothetical protein
MALCRRHRARSHTVPLAGSLTLALVLLSALAACGSAGTSGTGSASPNGSGGNGSTAASHLTLAGAVTGTIASVGTCSPASDALFKPVWTETIGGKLYLFQIALTHYTGASTYTTGQTEGSPTVDLTSESDGTGWHSQLSSQTGTIVLNSDLKSGTVDAVLTQDSGSSPATVHVTGSWVCAAP